jgi:hypothetical protein
MGARAVQGVVPVGTAEGEVDSSRDVDLADRAHSGASTRTPVGDVGDVGVAPSSTTVTSALHGCLCHDPAARAEFFALAGMAA